MYARIARLKGNPSKIDDLIADISKQGPNPPPGLEEMKGVYVLVNRDNGNIVTITLWEEKQAMDKSTAAGHKAWGRFKQLADTGEPEVETYEVGFKKIL